MKKMIVLMVIIIVLIISNCEKKSEQRLLADCVMDFMTSITNTAEFYSDEFVNRCKSDRVWSNFPSWKLSSYTFEKEIDRGNIDLKRSFLPTLCSTGMELAKYDNDLINELSILTQEANCVLIEGDLLINISQVDTTVRGDSTRYDWSCNTHVISYFYSIVSDDDREEIFSVNVVDNANCFTPSGQWQVLSVDILSDLNDTEVNDVNY